MNENYSGGRFRKKRINFSMVSNEILRDNTISLKAKGLYALIQSYITIDNFILYKGFLMSNCVEGRKAFDSAWTELKENGYLIQYRMKDEKNQFYYEYELLDQKRPLSQKGATGKKNDFSAVPFRNNVEGVEPEACYVRNGENINNSLQNNILQKNKDSIISFEDVVKQIEYPSDRIDDIVKNIITIMVEVYNTPDYELLRINKQNLTAEKVKERFKMVGYVEMESIELALRQYTGSIGSLKNFVLTSIYNAPCLAHIYLQTKMNHDLYG